MGATGPIYPTDMTPEEEAFGLEVRDSPRGVRAVVHTLDTGLQIVKCQRSDGAIE